jgi:hypothetical protein
MGRVVHYVDETGAAFPAIVRATYKGPMNFVDLTAFTEIGCRVAVRVPHSESHADFSWHWPEHVARP